MDTVSMVDPTGASDGLNGTLYALEGNRDAAIESYKGMVLGELGKRLAKAKDARRTLGILDDVGEQAAKSVFGKSIPDLSKAGSMPDRGGFSAAGRSLTKHQAGARTGSTKFPKAKGNPATINQQAQGVLDDILNNPGTTFNQGHRPRFGNTIEAIAPDGRGVVFDANGNFLFFGEF